MADFTDLVDLAVDRLGGRVLACNDEFFAEKENLLRAHAAEWDEHRYTDRGKWMDGWETRRRREPGHDWCIVRLGIPGVIRGVVVDTAYFRGNYPESCSLEAACAEAHAQPDDIADWVEILPKSALQGNAKNPFAIDFPARVTHLRLRIYPDGGVARLRVHGEPMPDWRRLFLRPEIDLAASENGGFVPVCSDMFFGSRNNLVAPGLPRTMGEGWETRRRRGPGNDWIVVKLATEGVVRRAEVDTMHFKGNSPGAFLLEGGASEEGPWREILPRTRALPDTRHGFDEELADVGPVTHVRLQVFPDGGVARLRVWGAPSPEGRARAGVARLDALFPKARAEALRAVCGSSRWVDGMNRAHGSPEALFASADEVWASCGPDDWHEAFRAHPRIGEKKGSRWSSEEQAGARGAEEAFLAANRDYEARFGHIFIVCATGRSADEMLGLLRARMGNDPVAEARVAAEEQRKITRIRLRKLVGAA
ncbi:MAG: allantoicase [Myxococcota bacterium]